MLFTSIAFLIFGVILFFTYYLLPKKAQWIVLLIGSGVFYFWAGWQYFLFLVGTIIITYCIGLLLGYFNSKKSISQLKRYVYFGRITCIFGIVLGIGLLFILKYLNFFGNIFSSIFLRGGQGYQAIDLIVPLGISFYTFSSIGYLIDVFRGDIVPEKNPFKYALFISFFPIVLQGPICSFSEMKDQLYSGHNLEMDNVSNGARRVVLGFFKKIVIADLIAVLVNTLFDNYADYHGFIMFFAIVLYTIQLYADFSGFMDISIGYAEMLGIKLPENFDMPLISKSMQVFWRKWHITLGRWFKKYVYIPLGGNRVPKWRWVINIMIVWLLTGLWHGASWNYVIWGVYNGLLLVTAGLLAKPINAFKDKYPRFFESKFYCFFQIVRTFYLVCIGFLLFRAPNLSIAWNILVESFKFWDWSNIFSEAFINLGIYWWMYFVIVGAILICYFGNSLFRNSDSQYLLKIDLKSKLHISIQLILVVAIISSTLLVFVYQLSLGQSGGSFIYFDF